MVRLGSDPGYRFSGEWLLAAHLRSQLSGHSLIPGEKFGTGNAQSVRALGERALIGDAGVQTRMEVWLPPLWQGIRVLAFYDYGRLKTLEPQLPATAHDSVGSVGFGLRRQYQTALSLSFDYGVVVQGHGRSGEVLNIPNTRGHDRLHFSAVVKF